MLCLLVPKIHIEGKVSPATPNGSVLMSEMFIKFQYSFRFIQGFQFIQFQITNKPFDLAVSQCYYFIRKLLFPVVVSINFPFLYGHLTSSTEKFSSAVQSHPFENFLKPFKRLGPWVRKNYQLFKKLKISIKKCTVSVLNGLSTHFLFIRLLCIQPFEWIP